MKSRDEYIEELLSAHFDGELTPDEAARAEQLLRDAEHREKLDDLRALRGDLRALPQFTLPADFHERVLVEAETRLDDQHRVDRRSTAGSDGRRTSGRPGTWSKVLLVAASVAAAIAFALVVHRQLPHLTPHGPDIAKQPPAAQAPDFVRPDSPEQTQPSELARRDEMVEPQEPMPSVEQPESPEAQSAEQIVEATPPDADHVPEERIDPKSLAREDRQLDAVWPEMNAFVTAEPVVPQDNGKLLFVVHVTLSPSGVRNRTFERVLHDHAIWLDTGITLDKRLEKALLEGRFIAGTEQKDQDQKSGLGLVYVEATALQVDFAARDLVALRGDVKRVQYDFTRKPSELDVFRQLHDESLELATREAARRPAQIVERGGPQMRGMTRGSARPILPADMPSGNGSFIGMFPEPVAAPEGQDFVPLMVDVMPMPEPELQVPVAPALPTSELDVGRMNPIVHTLFVLRLADAD